jgi:DNA-binding transcriptional ArsR family regulator
MPNGRKFPVYSYGDLKRFKELGIHTLHPEKREKFEQGFASYKRTNVLNGKEARKLILQQLASGPKTYDDLAAALGKARTTIQAHHIPILEKQGLVKRTGKREQAWLWTLAEPVPAMISNPAGHAFASA